MKNSVRKRAALLAASSVLAASASFGAAASDGSSPVSAVTPETVITAPLSSPAPAAADASEQAAAPVAKWVLAAFAAGALGWLVRLIGVRKAAAAVSRAAAATARGAATATGVAVKAAGRVVGTPLRWIIGLAGLGVFILTGVGLYDIEWIAGLVIGAGLALAGAAGLGKLCRKWLPGVKGN